MADASGPPRQQQHTELSYKAKLLAASDPPGKVGDVTSPDQEHTRPKLPPSTDAGSSMVAPAHPGAAHRMQRAGCVDEPQPVTVRARSR
jgi:hypothetical protein